MRLAKQLAYNLFRPFETVRLGTDVVFHNMVGNKPHWLDQDVRRLRLRFLPIHALSQEALFNRVPYDSSSLRDCTAKCAGFVIMWQPVATDVKTWSRDDYGAQTFRTTTSTGPPWQYVIRRATTALNTGQIIDDMLGTP